MYALAGSAKIDDNTGDQTQRRGPEPGQRGRATYLARSMVGSLVGSDVSVLLSPMAAVADRAAGWEGDDGEWATARSSMKKTEHAVHI